MGHKTQLHLGQTLDSQSRNIYECFIYDQNDKGFCVVTGSTSECPELIKKKDLIITAVNAVPEIIAFLAVVSNAAEPKTKVCRVCGWREHDTFCYVGKAEKLLLELEGVS